MRPGLNRTDDSPYPEAYRRLFSRLSGGGGLVSSLGDMIKLIRALMPPDPDQRGRADGSATLLRPETRTLMMTNQLAEGLCLKSSVFGEVRGKGHGLAGSVTRVASAMESPQAVGEFHWGGIAGTHWWIHPRHRLAGIVMTQRQWAFWHPFAFAWKRAIYQQVLGQ